MGKLLNMINESLKKFDESVNDNYTDIENAVLDAFGLKTTYRAASKYYQKDGVNIRIADHEITSHVNFSYDHRKRMTFYKNSDGDIVCTYCCIIITDDELRNVDDLEDELSEELTDMLKDDVKIDYAEFNYLVINDISDIKSAKTVFDGMIKPRKYKEVKWKDIEID